MEDLDLNIRFGPFDKQKGTWEVFASSPVGNAKNLMRFTPDMHWAQHAGSFDGYIANLRARQDPLLSEQFAQGAGLSLFNALIAGEVRNRYDRSRLLADTQNRRLRLVLHTAEAPELMILPWELLFDPHEQGHLCLSSNISLIRYIDLERIIPPLEIHGPLRILVVGANPDGILTLNIPHEQALIKIALRPLELQGMVKLHQVDQTTQRELVDLLQMEDSWHIVHFICHGGHDASSNQGFITLVHEHHGGGHRVLATHLGRLFSRGQLPRLVVLNSCEGGQERIKDPLSNIASVLIGHGIPALVAMQYSITDDAAANFAGEFYRELARGTPVDTAVTKARIGLSTEHSHAPEWATPVLYTHSPSSISFERTSEPVQQLKPTPPKPWQSRRH
jgi:hypothetical protein